MDTIKAFLEADAKRTQGEWSKEDRHKYAINTKEKHIAMVSYYHKSTSELEENESNANFIALASTLAPAIRTMLADIEMAVEVFKRVKYNMEHNREQDVYAISQALSALDKYKPLTKGE